LELYLTTDVCVHKGQTALKVHQVINEIWSTHQNESAKEIWTWAWYFSWNYI